MTDPTLPAQLAQFLGTLGTVEIIVRVSPPADNWLLDLVSPAERDRIRLKFFEEELGKLEKRLNRSGGLHIRSYSDRGEATVAGPPDAIYDLVRPGGVLAQHAQFEVMGRFRIVKQKLSAKPGPEPISRQSLEITLPNASPRLPVSN
jgi:hypothetical protein